ncbi:MAG: hypothetical protein ACODAQ_12325, partial [Phycisphaeraceae bacterium]
AIARATEAVAGEHVLVLRGDWPGLEAGDTVEFDEPVHAILAQNGSHHRAIPVTAVTAGEGAVRLRCERHPGFVYAAGVLKEVFSPFNSVRGEARIHLPDRAQLHRVDEDSAWRIVDQTSPITLLGAAAE